MINKLKKIVSFGLFNNYESIGKITDKINEIVDKVNNGSGDYATKDYVDSFFHTDYYTYLKLNNTGDRVKFPFFLNADYQVECGFYTTSYINNCPVFSSSALNIHLTMYSNKWYAGNGTGGEFNFGSYEAGQHTVIFNKNNGVYFDGEKVGDYTPTTLATAQFELGDKNGNQGSRYNQFITNFKITKISTGEVLCDYKPARCFAGDISEMGLLDVITGDLITSTGIDSVSNSIS